MEYCNYNGEDVWCISGTELIVSDENVQGIITESTYKAWKRRNKLEVCRRGGGKDKPVLISVRCLPSAVREQVRALYGEAEEKTQSDSIVSLMEYDVEAERFFKTYAFEYDTTTKGIDVDRQKEYCRSAQLLNVLKDLWNDHAMSRKKQGRRPLVSDFWKNKANVIRLIEGHTLPKSWRRLQETYNDYEGKNYESLLPLGKYGNVNTQKISKEAGEWLVAQWMSKINICTIEQLHARYNVKADEQGWKKLKTSKAVRDYLERSDVKYLWYAARYGELSFKEKFVRQNRTILAQRRDTLWYSDGTKLNYYYQDELGNVKTCNVYEVVDVYSEVFLGYHISRTEDFEAQYYAYRMAIKFSGHKPYELKFDGQGGHKKLESAMMLQNIATHAIRTAPYNGKSKTIESIFGRFQSQFLHQDWYFTGMNITTKKLESKTNMEFLLANGNQLPTLEEIKERYLAHRTAWNHASHHKTGVSRMQMYNTSVNDQTHKVDLFDLITMFGMYTKEPSTYRASGIQITVKKQKYPYEVLTAEGEPDRDFNRRNIGKRFYVQYQPDEMGVVLLYEKDATGFRYVATAESYVHVHRAMQDQTEVDLRNIRTNEQENKRLRIEAEQERNAILAKHGLHPNQYGLNVAPLKGITSGVKQKGKDIGALQKAQSNIMEAETIVKERRKSVRKELKKKEQQEKEFADSQREYNRRKRAMLEASM